MSYKRRMQLGAFLGLVVAALIGAAITHDNITGPALLLYPAGLIVGLVIAHMTAVRRVQNSAPTPRDYFDATHK
jgi:hypothetical protein